MSSKAEALPRITIITSTFNCAEALKKTVASIREQTYRNIQWIVADGASADGTVDVIKDNLDIATHWFSEPDSGIYDAWNKACQLIDGEWVLFLGAGDMLYLPETLELAAPVLHALNGDIIIGYGDVFQYKNNQLKFHFGEVDLKAWQTLRPALPCHQGVFQRSLELKIEKPFDDRYKIAADSKQMLMALHNGNISYININVAIMDMLGVSAHPRTSIKVLKELIALEKDLGYKIPKINKARHTSIIIIKFLLYKLTNEKTIEIFASLKRNIFK